MIVGIADGYSFENCNPILSRLKSTNYPLQLNNCNDQQTFISVVYPVRFQLENMTTIERGLTL